MARTTCQAMGATFLLALLTACSANHHSIFRQRPVSGEGSSVILIDAKQRAILVGKAKTKGGVQPFCAEASPDVFAVIAQALSAGGTFGQSADPKTVEAALSAAFSSSEQGSTIPRTQTISMLRELMFRTCERYLNEGITQLEMPLQAIRDQRLMVSILAIEQLTGAVTPKPVVIATQGQAAAGASGSEAAVRLDDAYKDLQAKAGAMQKRQNEFNELNTESKDCDAIAQAVAKKEEDKLSDALKAKKAKCESAAGALAGAKTEHAQSASHYAKLADTATTGGVPVSAGTEALEPQAGGGLDRAHSESIASVATVVRDIVELNFTQDEFLFFCLKSLSTSAKQQIDPRAFTVGGTQDACIAYIKSGIDLAAERNNKEIAASVVQRQLRVDPLFERFWGRVSADGVRADPPRVAIYRTQKKWWPTCFTDTGTKTEYASCFAILVAQRQRDLSAGK